LHHALKFALLLRGQMIKVGLHPLISSKQPRSLHLPSAQARGDGAPQSAKEPRADMLRVSNNPTRIVVSIVKRRWSPAFLRV
ncbi:MAG TPA: hypothetical protein DIW45_13670, partial [Erythrobacter sp.]|nr:hypothetical protein [Erythrobacter sp.]